MQFCKDCGAALNLFGKDGRELCSACIQYKIRMAPSPPTHREEEDDLLMDAVLSVDNSKIVLHSKEGWELWNGVPGSRIELKTLFARARRIYAIRLRRQKN